VSPSYFPLRPRNLDLFFFHFLLPDIRVRFLGTCFSSRFSKRLCLPSSTFQCPQVKSKWQFLRSGPIRHVLLTAAEDRSGSFVGFTFRTFLAPQCVVFTLSCVCFQRLLFSPPVDFAYFHVLRVKRTGSPTLNVPATRFRQLYGLSLFTPRTNNKQRPPHNVQTQRDRVFTSGKKPTHNKPTEQLKPQMTTHAQTTP